MQFYTNPEREQDPHALPDAEVFYNEQDKRYGPVPEESSPLERGYYWWPCFPGCLPDGEPNGPFDTEALAIADAQGDAANPTMPMIGPGHCPTEDEINRAAHQPGADADAQGGDA